MPDDIARKIAQLAQMHVEAAQIAANEAIVRAATCRARCDLARAWTKAVDDLRADPALTLLLRKIVDLSAQSLSQLRAEIAAVPRTDKDGL